MRKLLYVALVLPVFLFVLTGCSQKASNNSQIKSGDSNTANMRDRRPDFGQPDRQVDVRGVVKSIVGNEVTVLKLDMAGRGSGTGAASSTDEATNAEGTTTKNAVAVSLTGSTGGVPPGARQGGGMMGDARPGGSGEQDSTTRTQILEKLKEMSTGEEKIIIPIGIKMLKSSADSQNGNREMIEATLSDLMADKMISIWLNSVVTDKKVAEFVLIN